MAFFYSSCPLSCSPSLSSSPSAPCTHSVHQATQELRIHPAFLNPWHSSARNLRARSCSSSRPKSHSCRETCASNSPCRAAHHDVQHWACGLHQRVPIDDRHSRRHSHFTGVQRSLWAGVYIRYWRLTRHERISTPLPCSFIVTHRHVFYSQRSEARRYDFALGKV